MSFVNMMTKFGWDSSALTILMILKLNFCIQVDIINIIANRRLLPFEQNNYLENIGCSILKIRGSKDPILL